MEGFEVRKKNPQATRFDLGREIRMEEVDKANEYLCEHNLEPVKLDTTLPNTMPVTGESPAEPKMDPDSAGNQPAPPPDTTPPPQDKTITLSVPPGVEPTPIAEIDGWIRQGYLTRSSLETIMKDKHGGNHSSRVDI